ncbi:MAG: signal recognition particle subunit [Actinomycetota bacterium]|jgi:signal recognition particle subunit SRP54|nr:signal recognition particle subunit [Actinomycetota bacterium]
MFDTLSDRLDDIFTRLRSRGRLSEKQVDDVLREIRLALLEADVSLRVVKAFVTDVRERTAGAEIHKSLTPAQQVIKLVHEALIDVLGHEAVGLQAAPKPPRVIVIAGLQGSGKTTAAGKLARLLNSQGRRPLLAACDLRRPAAMRQLELLGEQANVPVHTERDAVDPVEVASAALAFGVAEGFTDLIVDTAGRLHVDPDLMTELGRIVKAVDPTEVLLVCDAMTGQDAVNVAEAFLAEVEITGIVLTKLDGDARGGAALSMSYVTQRPIKFAGVGEGLSDLEPFYPERMASRILGMGDMLTLIEKAEQAFDQTEAKKMEEKLRKADFTFDDFLSQLQAVKKMGPLSQVMGMLPGMSKLPVGDMEVDEQMPKIEAMIRSMTAAERNDPAIINGSRRSRIALGSGMSVRDVNALIKQFDQVRKLMKQMMGGKGGKVRLPAGMRLPPGLGV